MSTFRVNKNVNYTVMSNHHLQDKRLSLKAKGLLSYMLTLPQTDDTEPLGKYGRMRLAYLKNRRPVLYNWMLLNGTLWPHLQDVQKTACAWLERTMNALLDTTLLCARQSARTASLGGAHERAESAG